jgi:hypothetical protein
VGNLIGSMYMYKFSCACTYQASWARWVSFRVNLSRCHVRCTCLEGGWRELWGEGGLDGASFGEWFMAAAFHE